MVERHTSIPHLVNSDVCRIGDPPLSSTAFQINRLMRYLQFWGQQYNIFSTSLPPDVAYNPDGGVFKIPLPFAPKRDTDNPTRKLCGIIVPWSMKCNEGEVTTPNTVKWYSNPADKHTIFSSEDDTDDWITTHDYTRQLASPKCIQLLHDDFTYNPDAEGDIIYYHLELNFIIAAAIAIWVCPDYQLTSKEMDVQSQNIGVGRVIRGYTGTNNYYLKSIGDMIHTIGSGVINADTTEAQTRRVLFSWGHPKGIYSSDEIVYWAHTFGSPTYPATIKIKKQVLVSSNTENYDVQPVAVVTVSGITGAKTAGVRFTSSGTSDVCTYTITENGEQLLSGQPLTVTSPTDEILVEQCSPTNGEILVHSVAIYSPSQFDG